MKVLQVQTWICTETNILQTIVNICWCFHLFFKACTRGYVVNSCLANPDNEAVSYPATSSTNLWASWGAVMPNILYDRYQLWHLLIYFMLQFTLEEELWFNTNWNCNLFSKMPTKWVLFLYLLVLVGLLCYLYACNATSTMQLGIQWFERGFW